MNQAIQPAQVDATKRVLKKRRQLERRIAHLEAINTVLRKQLLSVNDQIAPLEERISNMSEHEQRIAELEAINLALRAELPSKNKRIAMLEEKLSTMSVDLASSRAREDKQRLLIRRLSQDSAMSENDGDILPAELIDDSIKSSSSPAPSSSNYRQFHRGFSLPGWVSSSISNDNNTILEHKQFRRSSQGRAMSVSESDGDVLPAEVVDESIKSSSSPPAQTSSPSSSNYRQFHRGFSLPGWVSSSISNSARLEDKQLRRSSQSSAMSVSESDGEMLPSELVDESTKSSLSRSLVSSSSSPSHYRQFQRRSSLPNWVSSSNTADNINDSARSSSGVGSIIKNMMKFERSNSCNNLRVDFPEGGREAYRLRMSGLRMSDLTADYSAEDVTSEQEEEQEHGEEGGQQTTPQRRRPNRSLMNRPHMGSNNSRLMSSTVVFPKVDDEDNLGFE